MRKRILMGILGAALWCGGPGARADVWDLGTDNDNGIGSDTEITHGLDQVHDLAAQQAGTVEDIDFYRFQVPAATSWEFVLDSMTGDISNGGSTPAFDLQLFVRVGSPVCALACTASDQYRIRAYETTLSVPRHNNANGQLTVLILQNNSGLSALLNVYAYGTAYGHYRARPRWK